MSGFHSRVVVLALATLTGLVAPATARAERADIERVVVSRDQNGIVTFRIHFADPVLLGPRDNVQVAIDADRDPATGVSGLDFSLDQRGSVLPGDAEPPALLTAVDGEPVESHPQTLRFSRTAAYGIASSSVAFSVPTSVIGGVRRFDFYVFIRSDGELDEAPSHVLFPAGAAPWTYPTEGLPAPGEPFPVETYLDNSDFTLPERGIVFLATVGGTLLILGLGVLAAVWGVRRIRGRRKAVAAIQ